jgi:hypothetical protein
LPVQVRDSILAQDTVSTAMVVPQSDANMQWFNQQHEALVSQHYAV